MNEDSVTPMTPLDSMVCQDSVQILKAVVPYLNGSGKQIVSVYAKALELMNTITYFQKNQPDITAMSAPQHMQPADILNDIQQYTSGAMKEQIDQLLYALNTLQLIQMMQETPEVKD